MRWPLALWTTVVCAGFGASTALAAPPGTDSQAWTELDLDAPLTGRVSLSALAAVRLGDGLPNPTLAAAGGGLAYRLSRHWSVAADDYWVRARSASSGRTLDLQLPLVALTYATRIAGFEIADRNRAERIVGLAGETWRYRNKISASHPLTLGPVRAVFVSNEVFYDVARESWTRNRAQLGVGLAPIGPTSLQIYLLRQDDRFSHPAHLNVLGLALVMKLGARA